MIDLERPGAAASPDMGMPPRWGRIRHRRPLGRTEDDCCRGGEGECRERGA